MMTILVAPIINRSVIAQQQIKLDAMSDKGAFLVEVMWTPEAIGKANTFEIHFFDPDTHTQIEDVKYTLSIYSNDSSSGGGNKLEVQRTDQVATLQKFSFDKSGSYTIKIENIENLGESAVIPIQVSPEFPIVIGGLSVLLFTATIIGGIVLLSRLNSNSLFSQQVK